MVGFWTMLIIQVILMVILELVRPKPDMDQKPAALGDFRLPTAQEDRAVPLIFGTIQQKGPNVVWYGDYKAVPIKEKVRTGMFSKDDVTKGHKYHLGLQMALARGVIDEITGIFVDDVKIFPGSHSFVVDDLFYAHYDKITANIPSEPTGIYIGSNSTEGYSPGDILEPASNRDQWERVPQLTVNTVDGSTGQILSFSISDPGLILPANRKAAHDGLNGGWTALVTGGLGTIRFRLAPSETTTTQTGLMHLGFGFTVSLEGAAPGIIKLRGRQYGVPDYSATTIGANGGAVDINCHKLFGGSGDFGNGGVAGTLVFRDGSVNQDVVPYLNKFQQINGETPAYRGTCFASSEGYPMYLGDSTHIKPWAFEVRRIPDDLNLGTDAVINGRDANPMNVLYEALTNVDWGLGLDPSLIDATNFATAGQTLANENHGYSQLWDREQSVDKFIKGIEEQIDGVLYQDTDGLFKIVLARGDYDLATRPEITNNNRISLEEFSRGTWSETTNMVYLNFIDGDDNWKSTYAIAQDQGNIKIQNGQPLTSTTKYSGVTNASLANDLAWRDLRTLSFPLAKATVTLDRSFWDVKPGEVVRFTDSNLGLTNMPMRVTSVNLGDLTKNTVRVTMVQDVFYAAAGSFDPRPPSSWTNPVADLGSLSQVSVQEAPRALEQFRAAESGAEPALGAIYANAVQEENMDTFDLYIGAELIAEQVEMNKLGALASGMTHDEADGEDIDISPIESTSADQSLLKAQFINATDSATLNSLENLILVDQEFMIVSSASLSGSNNVTLEGIYRGVLDSIPTPHSPGTPVYVVSAGGGLSESGNNKATSQQIRLVPRGRTGPGDFNEATAVTLDIVHRYNCPYPPSEISLNSTAWSPSVTMTANGADADTYYMELEITRRDFRSIDYVSQLSTDANTLDSSYPSAHSTEHYWTLTELDGTVIAGPTSFPGRVLQITRNELLAAGADHNTEEHFIRVGSSHTYDSVTYESVYETTHPFNITWGLEGQQNLGFLTANTASTGYTVDSAGVHVGTLVNTLSQDVEYRVNGGSWTTLIAAGSLTGGTSALSTSDTLEIRHTDTSIPAASTPFLAITAPVGGTDAFALLT